MDADVVHWLGRTVEVEVEVSRGGVLKRGGGGQVVFRSPVPTPFNYGSVPGVIGGDGDQLDAIVLGPTLARGTRTRATVWGIVRFVDDGLVDDKLVCGKRLTAMDRMVVRAFFAVYVPAKRAAARWRGPRGWTGVRAILWAC